MLRKKNKDTFVSYLEDSSGLSGGYADEIVFPESETEVCEFLKERFRMHSAVTISGGGTGVTGGRIPFGGAILSSEKMNGILEIRKFSGMAGGIAVVEPGVRIEELKKEISKAGLAYLPDPTEKNAFICGTVSTNASGARGFKHGPTRNAVNRLRVVLAEGEVLELTRGRYINKGMLRIPVPGKKDIAVPFPGYRLPRVKNSVGYFAGEGTDLIDLFIGQEGTLGFISLIELKLGVLPEDSFAGVVFFAKEEPALDLAERIKKHSFAARQEKAVNAIDASCVEYYGEEAMSLLSEKHAKIPLDKKAAIYFEQDVKAENKLEIMEKYQRLFDSLPAQDMEVWWADSSAHRDFLNAMRHDLPVIINEKTKISGFSKISSDAAVPEENFREMFYVYKNKIKEAKLAHVMFGHIGENHLHVNLLPQGDKEFIKAKQVYRELLAEAVRLEGTISAEHGVGKLKREYLKIMFSEEEILKMAAIKRALDPGLILGRGNVFPDGTF